MEFKTNKPIYQQIVDFCFSKILTREWRAEERVVSVRELSTQLAVNSRTVMKAYEYLQAEDIIYPERGMGFYLAAGFVQQEPTAHRQRAAPATGQHPHHRCGGHYQLVEEQLLHQGGHRGRRTVCTAEGGKQRQEVIKMEEKSMEKYGAAGH